MLTCKHTYVCMYMCTPSIVLFDQVYISDVVPRTSYNETLNSYFLSATVYLDVVSQPSKTLVVHVDTVTDAADHDEFEVKGVSVFYV